MKYSKGSPVGGVIHRGRPLLLLVALLLSPAWTSASNVPIGEAEIITRGSDHADFFGYWTQVTETGLKIRGTLRKSPRYPSTLGGLIRVQLLDVEGRVLRTFDVGHRHLPLKRMRMPFEVEVPDLPPGTRTIRLVHLDRE